MPSNWISLHPGLKKKVIESIFIRCEKIVRDFSRKNLVRGKSIQGIIQPAFRSSGKPDSHWHIILEDDFFFPKHLLPTIIAITADYVLRNVLPDQLF